MKKLKTFRHEFKFNLSYSDMLAIRKKLDSLLDIDQSSNGYIVRSLYFDTINNKDYYDKMDGLLERKKVRLRIYSPHDNKVKLEIKNKSDIHQLKESLIISKDDAKEIIKGNYHVLLDYQDDLAYKMYLILSEGYFPKVIIEYDRIAYVSKNNTRITFDLNVRKCADIDTFFDEKINYFELTDKKDVILEVKFDRYLEPFIGSILSKYDSQNESISKYILGRNE